MIFKKIILRNDTYVLLQNIMQRRRETEVKILARDRKIENCGQKSINEKTVSEEQCLPRVLYIHMYDFWLPKLKLKN